MLEESLEEFPGAVVLVSHDRDLMDRLCTEVIGLDGRGGSWRTAASGSGSRRTRRTRSAGRRKHAKLDAETLRRAAKKAKKLSYREQKEWDGMEAAVHAAEEVVVAKQAAVEAAGTAGHVALTEACRELEDAATRRGESVRPLAGTGGETRIMFSRTRRSR